MVVISIAPCKHTVRTDDLRASVIEFHVLELRQITLSCVARVLRAALFDNRKSLHLSITSESEIASREKKYDRENISETKVFANAVDDRVYHLLTSKGAQFVTFRKPTLFLGGALKPNARSESIDPVANWIAGALHMSASNGHDVFLCVVGSLGTGKVEQSCQVRPVFGWICGNLDGPLSPLEPKEHGSLEAKDQKTQAAVALKIV